METVNKITDVLRAVSIIYSDKFKEPELAQLVKLVQKISLSYLKYQELMGRKLRQYSITDSNELQDLALDCIAGLFIRNSKGEFIQLKKYFGDSAEDFHRLSENEVLVLLKRLVVKKTKQELCRIFKEREPEKAKILRNIKLSIKTTSDFHSFKDAGREYLCFNAGRERMLNSSDRKVMEVKRARFELESNDHSRVKPDYVEKGQPEIPDGILLQEYLSLFHPRDTVPTCIRKMLTIVKDDQRYRDYLPLDTAAKIIHRTNIEL
ncbi:MAG: hypothetical protein ACE5G1_07055, partial [bacterium]